ncbi:hypothetical protein HOC_19176 [Hyphomonas oceanitis SCH89]|uniref:Phospholipase D n=2 Tax=Hyphomonas oceanitis TaxID=81033 RepID=A0A059G2B7_9PROT|nr:hypothetical protein HOC_19176 [Hyphomonas oceanitis SCH89]
MITDGEKLKRLLSASASEVILCAPFIKKSVIDVLLAIVPEGVSIKIYTRWNAWDVAAGVTDLDVFDACKERLGTELLLVDNLHAKAYVSDQSVLIGSANLTNTALGWAKAPNLEILIETDIAEHNVAQLLNSLERSARRATRNERDRIADQASRLAVETGPEAATFAGELSTVFGAWFPKCAVPEHLYSVYRAIPSSALTDGALDDAKRDLKDLSLPSNLGEHGFLQATKSATMQMTMFQEVIERASSQLTDRMGMDLVRRLCPGCDERDAIIVWATVRNWVQHFFNDEFEVAPSDHVIRIRS